MGAIKIVYRTQDHPQEEMGKKIDKRENEKNDSSYKKKIKTAKRQKSKLEINTTVIKRRYKKPTSKQKATNRKTSTTSKVATITKRTTTTKITTTSNITAITTTTTKVPKTNDLKWGVISNDKNGKQRTPNDIWESFLQGLEQNPEERERMLSWSTVKNLRGK